MKTILLAVLLSITSMLSAKEIPLKDFKPEMKRTLKEAQRSETDFVTTPPALKLDSDEFPGKPIISSSLYAFQKFHPPFRGETIRFKAMAKRLFGNAELSITFRCNIEPNELIAYKEYKFKPTREGEFFPITGDFVVPDVDKLAHVNISITYRNTGNVRNLWLLDDIVFVTVIEDAPDTATLADGLQLWQQQPPLPLVEQGKPVFTIALPDRPDAITKMAAAELVEHIRLATGVAPEIVPEAQVKGTALYLGETQMALKHGVAPSQQQPDHFVIARLKDAVILAGGEYPNTPEGDIFGRTATGTLYAAYEFLESLFGVRWYWPGKLGTVVPKVKELSIQNLYRSVRPTEETRWLFHRQSSDPAISDQEMLLWQKRQRTGAGAGNATGMHAFQAWPKKFGETHPEYFALQSDGTRKTNSTSGVHLCLSNPAVLQAAIDEKIAFFQANPRQRFSSIMPGDSNTLYNCRCENCLKLVNPEKGDNGVHSNMVWRFVNQVADGVAKVLPGRVISCCAYADYQAKPDFPLSNNVAVTLCFDDLPQDNPLYKEKLRRLLDDWSSTGARIYLWEYWCYPRIRRGTFGAPSFFARQLPELHRITGGRIQGRLLELPFYNHDGKNLNADWADWPFDVVNLYVALKLLWQPDADVDAMLEEYFTLFFGPAAPQVGEFYREMEQAWGSRPLELASFDWATCWKTVYPPEFVDRMMALLKQAEDSSRGQEPYHARTVRLREGFKSFEESSNRFRGPKPAENPKEIKLPVTESRPVIDGRADEAIWQSATAIGNFIDSYAVYTAQAASTVRLLRTQDTLYLAVTAQIPPSHKETKFAEQAGTRDGLLWNYEGMEFFFVDSKQNCIQFILSPDQKLADFRHPSARPIEWNAEGVEFATNRTPDGWTGELAIPLSLLPENGGKWSVNFARNHYFRKSSQEEWTWEQSCWQPTFGPFNTYSRFGEMLFI